MNRRELMVGIGAAAVLPTAAIVAAPPGVLDPLTYKLATMVMDMPDIETRRELRIAFRMPTEDAAYENFTSRFREMTADEWIAFRTAHPL